MSLKILKNGDEGLRRKSMYVDSAVFGTDELILLKNEMLAAMALSGGVGLAAPQIGRNIRMFVMADVTEQFVCINPSITKSSETTSSYKEGCLSFPGLELSIVRPVDIEVAYYTERGEYVERELRGIKGIWARCFQHEYDHLDGILFTSHVSKIKLDIAKRKAKINVRKMKSLKRK